MKPDFFSQPWVWFSVTILSLALCTFLPIYMKHDKLRKWMYWIILVPVSLVIIFYVYPAGIELFRLFAVSSGN